MYRLLVYICNILVLIYWDTNFILTQVLDRLISAQGTVDTFTPP